LGIDKTTLCTSSAGCRGLVVPEKVAFALVDVVCETAEAKSAGMMARRCCASLKRVFVLGWPLGVLAGTLAVWR
jgi:hypothetical protein